MTHQDEKTRKIIDGFILTDIFTLSYFQSSIVVNYLKTSILSEKYNLNIRKKSLILMLLISVYYQKDKENIQNYIYQGLSSNVLIEIIQFLFPEWKETNIYINDIIYYTV